MTGEEADGQRNPIFRGFAQHSGRTAVQPIRPGKRRSAEQSGFVDRDVRVVTLALGDGLGISLGCVSINGWRKDRGTSNAAGSRHTMHQQQA